MNISNTLAQQISDQLREIIQQDINYISTEGIIVASTDRKRIGQSHGGAKIVVTTKETLVIEDDETYQNSKKGINIPIIINNQIVGIIGITGERDDVEHYGNIIKKMTELMIKENELNRLRLDKRNNYRKLIDEFTTEHVNILGIEQLSKELNLRMDIPQFFVLGEYSSINGNINDDTIYEFLKHYFIGVNQIIYSVSPNKISIIYHCSDSTDVEIQLAQLVTELQSRFDIKVHFGIGTISVSIPALKESYRHAQTALNWNQKVQMSEITNYDQLDIGLLLAKVDVHAVHIYLEKILGILSTEELKEYKQIVQIYIKNNGSITKSADELFIHKNTLQNKIIKLKRKTNYDLRNLSDFLVLGLAFTLLDF